MPGKGMAMRVAPEAAKEIVVFGLATPSIVGYFAGMETLITPWSVVIAASVSLAVGIIFGIYPARQAARLDPIEALRRG